jgi:hypothetical protein
MPITKIQDPDALHGASVRGNDGSPFGKIEAIYCDSRTRKPEWAAVKRGLFGGHVSLVPLAQSGWDREALTVPFDKAQLKSAPHHDPVGRGGTATTRPDRTPTRR